MNSATVEEAEKLRKDLEGNIHKLITEFEFFTGLHVLSLELIRLHTMGGNSIPHLAAVNVDVILPRT